jgi:hypothetical protein
MNSYEFPAVECAKRVRFAQADLFSFEKGKYMSIRLKKNGLSLSVSSLALLTVMSASEAMADCVGTPADNATIACTSDDADGLDATGFTNQTITTAGGTSGDRLSINGMVVDNGNTLLIDRYTELDAVGTGASANGLNIGDGNTVDANTDSNSSNFYVTINSDTATGFVLGNNNQVDIDNYSSISGSDYGIDAGNGNTFDFGSYVDLAGGDAGARFGDSNDITFSNVAIDADTGVIIGDGNTAFLATYQGTAIDSLFLDAGDNNDIEIQAYNTLVVNDGDIVHAGNGNTIRLGRSYQALNGSLVVAGDDTTIEASGPSGAFGDVIFKLGDRATINGGFIISDEVVGGVLAEDDLKFNATARFTASGKGIEAGDRATIAMTSDTDIEADDSAVFVGDDLELVLAGRLRSNNEPTIEANDRAKISNYGSIYGGDVAVSAHDYLEYHNYGLTASTIQANSFADITVHEGSLVYSTHGYAGIEVEDDSVITVNGVIDDGYDPDNVAINPVTGEEMTLNGSDAKGVEGDDRNTVRVSGTIRTGDAAIDLDDENTVEILETGMIFSSSTAVDTGDDMMVTNYGTIEADNHGIKAKKNSTVYNYGDIRTAVGDGLKLDSTGTTAYNYGTINSGDEGIEGKSDFVLENYGTVIAIDDAVQADDNMYVLNYGTLESTGVNTEEDPDIAGDGIDIDYGIVDNYGIIRAAGIDQGGIDFDEHKNAEESTTIYNRQGALIQGGYGIFLDPEDRRDDVSPKTIHNWGTIVGTSGSAIELGAGDDTLIVYQGSRISGTIDLGETAVYDSDLGAWTVIESETDNDTFSYQASGPAIYVFENALPETIISASTPYVVSGYSVIFMDAGETVVADQAMVNVIGDIGSTLSSRMEERFGNRAQGDAEASMPPIWLAALGGYSHADRSSGTAAHNHAYGGVIGGVDGFEVGGFQGGVTFGATHGALDFGSSMRVNATTVFGGLYGANQLGEIGRLELSMLGGVGFNNSTRDFATNLAENGATRLTADYTTGFVSPEAAITFDLAAMDDTIVTARPSVRYIGLFSSAIEEAGQGAVWSTGARSTHIVEGRLALSGERTFAGEDGAIMKIGASGGVVAQSASGDDTDLSFSMFNQSGSTTLANAGETRVGGFGGVKMSRELAGGGRMFGEVEGTMFDGSDYSVSGKVGLEMGF